jgi:hypothetical protein
LNKSENNKIKPGATGPKPRSAQSHSAGAATRGTAPAHRRQRGTAARHDGDGRAASEAVGVARRWSGRWRDRRGGRGDSGGPGDGGAREAGGASEASCRDVQRAIPTAALSCGVGVARGSHAATARCRAGPARRTASDRWGPLVSDFRIKNHPNENSTK